MRPPRPCQDLCAGVTCTSPPNPLCYPFTGTCTSGTCSYTPFPDDTSCIFGTNDFGTYDGTCQGGQCLVSPGGGRQVTGLPVGSTLVLCRGGGWAGQLTNPTTLTRGKGPLRDMPGPY
jgi:hypothetical protein